MYINMDFQYPPKQTQSDVQQINTEKMSKICDEIINIGIFLNKNKEDYKNNKDEILKKVKDEFPNFYNLYPRICRALVFESDITPLLGMIQTFGKVQEGKMSWEKANDSITNALNTQYVDPILNSEKLVKEREEKQKMVDITK